MTLPSTPFRKDHTGNGTTGPFLYDWKILSNTHLQVVHQVIATGVETVLVLGVDYNVTGVGNSSGGNVNLTDILPNTEKITILPNVPYEQDTDFTNQNSVKPTEAEEMADKLGRQVKQLAEQMSRAVTLPPTSTDSPENYISTMNQILADTVTAKNSAETARDNILNDSGFIIVAADLLGSDTIGTVAGAIASVISTAGSIANVNTVAGSIANVNIVAPSIASVNTVATNIASVNSAATNMAAIIAAPTHATNASNSATAASGSATLANKWANEAEDVVVSGGQYSAYHWMKKAQAAASNVAANVTFTNTNSDTTATNVQTALQDVFSGRQYVVTANSGTAYALNQLSGKNHNFKITLTGNCTFTITNPTANVNGFVLFLKQDATGSRTVTWPASVDWSGGTAPTLTGTANSVDVFVFITPDGGTTWMGFLVGADVK